MHASDPEFAVRALSALERAYERLVFALRLPAPSPDEGRGGSDALDAYQVPPTDELRAVGDPPRPGAFVTASASCRLPMLDGALLERAATLCVAEAIGFRLDPSETPFLRRALATSLWWSVGLPTALDVQAIDDAQAHPESPLGDRDRSPTTAGAALWLEYLDDARGAGEPGVLGAAVLAAAASAPARGSLDHDNEPDMFDVLRHSLGQEREQLAGPLSDFAVARAFLGDRGDGAHLPRLGFAGWFGRVRFDWVVRASSLPRRVSIHPPLSSTGSALIWLELDRPLPRGLGVQVEWERPVSFQWQLVRIGGDGREIGRLALPYRERAHEAEARLVDLKGTRAVLVVGTNLEGVALSHPFDPDVAPFEPHGATVHLLALPSPPAMDSPRPSAPTQEQKAD